MLAGKTSSNRRRGGEAGCGCCDQAAGVVDDNNLSEAKVFGEKAGYWDKHNDITDKYDEDMMGRLNSELDNLLIFAGLFSAVNSTFLVATLGALSPNPADETNTLLRLLVLRADNGTLTANDLNPPFAPTPDAIRQNCVFFASLFSSLLAAAGAVLAKQWLANYERTGQTGPLDEQALRRTEKYLDSSSWAWPTTSGLSTAALSPQCPFQTAPSAMLVDFIMFLVRPIVLIGRNTLIIGAVVISLIGYTLIGCPGCVFSDNATRQNVIGEAMAEFLGVMGDHWTPAWRLWSPRNRVMKSRRDVALLHAESARSMLDISPHEDVIISVARNILAIKELQGVQYLARSTAVLSLAARFNTLLLSLRKAHSDSDLEQTLLIARALVHVLSADPIQHGAEVLGYLLTFSKSQAGLVPEWLPSPELKVLWTCIVRLCAQVSTLKAVFLDSDVTWKRVIQDVPCKALITDGFGQTSALEPSTVERYLHHFILSEMFTLPRDQFTSWWAELDIAEDIALDDFIKSFRTLVSSDTVPTTRSLLSLAARALSIAMECKAESEENKRSMPPRWDIRLSQAWSICSGESLDEAHSEMLDGFEQLFEALETSAYIPVDLLHCHTQLIRRLWEASSDIRARNNRRECSSSAQSYRVVSGILDRSGYRRPASDVVRELELWRIAFHRSLSTLVYPSLSKLPADSDGTGAQMGRTLESAKELVAMSGADASHFLHLFRLEAMQEGGLIALIKEMDWLLVLLGDLIVQGVVPVSATTFSEVGIMLDAHLKSSKLPDDGTATIDPDTYHKRWSTRLKVIGALLMATFSAEDLNKPFLTITRALVDATVAYIDAVCEDDDLQFAQVPPPHSSNAGIARETISGPWMRMKLDHIVTFCFIEHVASHHPTDVAGSGLQNATEKLISKLERLEDETLRKAVERARSALGAVVGAPPVQFPTPQATAPASPMAHPEDVTSQISAYVHETPMIGGLSAVNISAPPASDLHREESSSERPLPEFQDTRPHMSFPSPIIFPSAPS